MSVGNTPANTPANTPVGNLAPGTYRLKGIYTNPNADRRFTRDWRKRTTWDQSMVFRVDEGRLYLVGSAYWSEYINLKSLPPGLTEWLQVIPETDESFFDRLGVQRFDGFSRWLVTSGYMTRKEFESLYTVFTDETGEM